MARVDIPASDSWLSALDSHGATDALAGGRLSELGKSEQYPFAPESQKPEAPRANNVCVWVPFYALVLLCNWETLIALPPPSDSLTEVLGSSAGERVL